MIADKNVYVVAGRQPWNKDDFDLRTKELTGQWHFITTPAELHNLWNQGIRPTYAFFLHWSNIVPSHILKDWECICFHMTDLPYGRGGSPLQNLILNGYDTTKLSALRMTDEIDAGPIYMKSPLCIKDGNAEQIYKRASRLSFEMIEKIIHTSPKPIEQKGAPIPFKRRKPEQSELPQNLPSLQAFHDYIRMLDAPDYPHAFIDLGDFRLYFTSSTLDENNLKATVTIKKKIK